jgi:hypothetical protein
MERGGDHVEARSGRSGPVGLFSAGGVRLGSQFQYSLLELNKPFVVGVNVVALAVFAFLTWELRRERREQTAAEVPAEAVLPTGSEKSEQPCPQSITSQA